MIYAFCSSEFFSKIFAKNTLIDYTVSKKMGEKLDTKKISLAQTRHNFVFWIQNGTEEE
jgi:hypothetical protein